MRIITRLLSANNSGEVYENSFNTMILLGDIVILIALVIAIYVIRTTISAKRGLLQFNLFYAGRYRREQNCPFTSTKRPPDRVDLV
jgi:hypothetical protein